MCSCDNVAIEVVGVTKKFGDTLAVDGLSLNIASGSTFGLLGPNGSGKSTVIKILMGLLPMSSGEARILGIDVSENPTTIKQRVGYVPETHHIYRSMRVAEVIGFCRAAYRTWNDKTCRDMLDMFRLDPQKKVQHLSKGMLAKLALLIALSHDPEVLLLDEPVSGLDPLVREEFLDGVLRAARKSGQTALFSSHTFDDIQHICDSIGILYGGRLLIQGRLDELLGSVKRVRVALRKGQSPRPQLSGTIYARLEGREWRLTVADLAPSELQRIRQTDGIERVDVLDVGLSDFFKDVVRGQEASR